jgi:SAM-dependent methyltransferase
VIATSRPVTSCQGCAAPDLVSVLFLGYHPPVNTMPAIGAPLVEQAVYPLELLRCEGCGLVQIGTEVDQDVLFPPSYPYRSGSTAVLRDNFADLCRESRDLLVLRSGNLVVDIGSNDGTLLANFQAAGLTVLGVEPSEAGERARERGVPTLTAFFGPRTAQDIVGECGHASLVTAANVFAHIPDVHAVLDAVTELCGEDGVFVSESHYLPDLVANLQYDAIYHEHLRYYDLHSLASILDRHGLEIIHARRIPPHGGSIRVYASRAGRHEVHPSVAALLAEERDALGGSAFTDFRTRVAESKRDLLVLLAETRRRGERVYGIGAPSRAATLLNYIGADEGLIDCVLELASSPKVDKYMPGTTIPVLDEKKLLVDQPEYALLLSWHLTDELTGTLRRKGFRGRFIVPLPVPRLLT